MALLALMLYLLAIFHRCGKQAVFLSAVVVAALAAYVKPICILLGAVTVFWMLIQVLRSRSGRIVFLAVFGLLLNFAVLDVWYDRNSRLAGYGGFSAIAEINLHEYTAASILARAEGVSWRGRRV